MVIKKLHERPLTRVFMSNYLLSVLFIHLIQIHMYDYVLKVMNSCQFRDPVKRKKKK